MLWQSPSKFHDIPSRALSFLSPLTFIFLLIWVRHLIYRAPIFLIKAWLHRWTYFPEILKGGHAWAIFSYKFIFNGKVDVDICILCPPASELHTPSRLPLPPPSEGALPTAPVSDALSRSTRHLKAGTAATSPVSVVFLLCYPTWIFLSPYRFS